jgi:hypothetical protein
MPDPAKPTEPALLARRLRRGLGLIALGFGQAGDAGLRLTWLWTKRAAGIVLALILLFEQWGWEYLVALFAGLRRLSPVAALERGIARLPPYGALVAFGLPTVFLVPLKLAALYLIARGHAVMAGALFVAAKVVGTALVARLYQLTEPQLMQIGWFKRAFDLLMPALHALHEQIRRSWAWRYGRMLKTRAKHVLAPMITRLRARVAGLLQRRVG